MPNPSTSFPAGIDSFGAGDWDPAIGLAVDAMQCYDAPAMPTSITPVASTVQDNACSSNLQIASGTLYLTAMTLPAGLLIKNFSVPISVASSADITHAWMGIFDTAYKVVAVSADVTSGGTTAAATLWTLPVANIVGNAGVAVTSFTTTRAGLYYFGVMAVVTTTQPTLSAALAVDANGRGHMVPYLAGASTTSSTTPPSVTTVVAQTTPSTAGKQILAYLS